MKKHQKQIFALAVILVFTATVLLLTGLSEAGKPERPDQVMDMLQDIYDVVVDTNSKVDKVEGVLIQKTGQTTSYATGDDGDLKEGMAWPDPRFFDNEDGTVTDYLTGLIWLKDANCTKFYSDDNNGENLRGWSAALTVVNLLASGHCGLSDGSSAEEWRLPNVRELQSLVDYGKYGPALPSDHHFQNVQSLNFGGYWSSTTLLQTTNSAWYVYMYNGHVHHDQKGFTYNVWPVRGGN